MKVKYKGKNPLRNDNDFNNGFEYNPNELITKKTSQRIII